MTVEQAYYYLYMAALIWIALLITVSMIRTFIGPLITDRVISINMIGTLVIGAIAILSVLLSESYLVDVALIYAMISFLSVLILVSVYLPKRKLRHAFEKKDSGETAPATQEGEEQTDER